MKFKFRKGAEVFYSDDDFYALCNGYCNPEELLEDANQVNEVLEAVALLEQFISEARESGAIGEM